MPSPFSSYCLTLGLALIGPFFALATPPDQFRVWGTAGPDSPPVPAGWTCLPGEEGTPHSLIPTPKEREQGFVLFARNPFSPVLPTTIPAPVERTTELRTFATPGEYESLALAIHALEDLKSVQATVSDLRSATGDTIPADHLDLRVSRAVPVIVNAASRTYTLQPFLLEKRPSFPLSKARSVLLWVTLKVPDTAAPGEYVGTISLLGARPPAAEVKLRLSVLPFKLPPSLVESTLYYPRPAKTDDMLETGICPLAYPP